MAFSATCARGIGCDRIGEDGASSARHEAHAPPRSRQREQQIGPDVGLEIDAEIVVPVPPRTGMPDERGPRQAAPVSRHPRRVEGLDMDVRYHIRQRAIPASDDEVNRGVGSHGAHHGDGVEHHQQVADALQPEQKDAARRGNAAGVRSVRPSKPLHGGQAHVCQSDEYPFLPIGNLKVLKHYRIPARSIMTPSARSSAPPNTSRGVHVVLSIRTSLAAPLAASSAASPAGMANA